MSAPDLAAHLSPAELGQRYRAARCPVERSQLQIVWLLSQGRDDREVARVTGYGRRWVAEVMRRYNEGGPDGLGDRPSDGGLWTGPKVAAWIGARLGRRVWPQRGWDYLRRLGHSPQVPRPRHAKAASPEGQAVYKKARRAGARASRGGAP